MKPDGSPSPRRERGRRETRGGNNRCDNQALCPRKHMPVGPRVCRPAGLKNGPSSSPNGFRSSWPMRPCACRVYVEGSEPLDELKRRAASDMYSTLLLPKGCRLRWCGRRRRKGRQELDARVRAGKGGGLWGGGARESQLLNRIWRRPPARVERRGRRGALLELSGNVALALEQPGEPPQQRMIATTASGRSNQFDARRTLSRSPAQCGRAGRPACAGLLSAERARPESCWSGHVRGQISSKLRRS